MDPRVLIPTASAVTYFIYKRFEPANIPSAILLLFAIPGLLVHQLRSHFSGALSATAVIFSAYWALIVLYIIAYRLSPLHPLAKYPGPLLCKVSKLWVSYIASTGKYHLYAKELHDQYGEMVRIGPNELSVSNKDFGNAVLGPKGLPRGPYYNTREHDAGVSLDGLRDTTLHTARRKPWARGMNSAAMKHYEGLIQSTVHDLLDALHKREGKKTDISMWMTAYGFDFMGHMAFTHDFGMLETGQDPQGLNNLIEKALIEAAWISHISWAYPFLKHLPGATKSWTDMQAVGENIVKRRVSTGSNHRDLFHYLMDEEGNEAVKPSIDIAATDGMLAIIAGSDTAATTLSHLWYFLHSNLHCLKRLQKEIDDAFPRGEDSLADLARQGTMPYLNACINETLRLLPPVLAPLQRRVESGMGGKMIGQHFVPDETQISLCAYAIHRDQQHFYPLTETFWPDRWLVQKEYVLPTGMVIGQHQVVVNRDVFMPFSQGPMVCAGKNVALAEMRALVCAVLQHFDFESVDKTALSSWEDGLQEVFTTKRGALPVVLRARA